MAQTSSQNPRISIICPTMNAGPYFEGMIKTVVAQTYPHWELLIIDSVSKDGTVEMAQKYAASDPRIKIVSEKDEGPWHAIEKGVHMARGEFFSIFGGQDGVLDKEWFQKCINVIDTDPTISLVWGFMATSREDGTLLEKRDLIHAATSHFLEKQTFSQRLRFLVRKFFKVISDLLFASSTRKKILLKKIFSKNAGMRVAYLTSRSFPDGKVPQKEEWFRYWLDTGFFFPDQSILINKEVYLRCLEKREHYPLGKHSEYHLTYFNYNFLAQGYLAYCIPEYAIFGRVHKGNSAERISEEMYNDQEEFLERTAALKKRVVGNHEEVVFRDRQGNSVAKRTF